MKPSPLALENFPSSSWVYCWKPQIFFLPSSMPEGKLVAPATFPVIKKQY